MKKGERIRAEWNFPPKTKDVFFDDFSEGVRGDVWRALHEKWKSQKNNGYSDDNCMYTTDPEKVKAEGGTGGLVIIRSIGDFADDSARKRQGGGIVTKRLFGPGRYEVRMKVVPRVGQCSAAWTYFNDWAPTLKERKYSEIDIEAPHGGDYRVYSGTTYENYLNGEERISRSETIETPPLNDGKWHVLAFEWRTDKERGDEGIVWYRDGLPVLRIDEAVPRYTATFWIASLFQDAIVWLGNPQFETAYMYIDWVKITEYEDPILQGNAERESLSPYHGRDLSDFAVPHTDYIANGNFSQPAVVESFKGRRIASWELRGGAEIVDGKLTLPPCGMAMQTVTAQYCGYAFEAEALAEVEEGEIEIVLECLEGKANCEEPQLKKCGECSERLVFRKGDVAKKKTFHVGIEETEHVRIKISADGSSRGRLVRVSMKMVDG